MTSPLSQNDYHAMMLEHERGAGFADMEEAFFPLFNFVRPMSMASIERHYEIYKAVEYVCQAGLVGDFVEAGAWKGGGAMMMALTAARCGQPERHIWLFDTFEGHPHTDRARDIDLWGKVAEDDWHPGWGATDVVQTARNMDSVKARFTLVKGLVEHTAPWTETGALALVRIDVDWYAPTKAILETLWPRLVRGGIVIVDDYGHYKGQRQAVDEYFKAAGPVKLSRVDYSCRTIQKP